MTDAQANPRIGTVLIHYDAHVTGERTILHWIDTVVDEGIRLANENFWQNANENELQEIVRKRLKLRLPECVSQGR